MIRNHISTLLLLFLAVGFAACGTDEAQVMDASGDSADDVSFDVDFDIFEDGGSISCGDRLPDEWQAEWCLPETEPGLVDFLIPRPVLVRGTSGPDAVSPDREITVWLSSADPSDDAAMKRIESAFGLRRSACEDASLKVFVLPDDAFDNAQDVCDITLTDKQISNRALSISDNDEAYTMFIRTTVDMDDVVVIAARSAAGRGMAFHTLARFVHRMVDCHACLPETMFIADAPAIADRGVIETFYGAPYTESERKALLPYLAGLKFNQYLYAAKMDVWINWIGPYWTQDFDSEYVDFLERLAGDIREAGMIPGIQVRPLDQVVFSSSEDLSMFVDKVRFFVDLGFQMFSLSFDDTDEILLEADALEFDSYDEAVLDFSVNALKAIHEQMPDLRLGWVPNDYWSQADGAGQSLSAAGEKLPQYVSIGWTGREVMPAVITAADADEVAGWLQRRPLLGDNYPVWEPTATRYFLGPVTGRANDLADHLAGIMFNPNPAPFPSLPALATCADYAWNTKAYDPLVSTHLAARYLAGFGPAADALEIMAADNVSHVFNGSMAPDLKQAIDDLWLDFEDGDNELSARAVTDIVAAYLDVPANWAGDGPSTQLRDALMPYAEQTGRLGVAALEAVRLLGMIAAGTALSADDVDAFDSAMAGISQHDEEPTGDVMKDFLEKTSLILHPEASD